LIGRSVGLAASLAVLLVLAGIGAHLGAQGTAVAYTVFSREGRRPLPVRTLAGQEMFALDDLARLFELTLREDAAAGGLTVGTRAQSIVLTAGQPIASVGGRLISLPAAPARDGRAWFVPTDFVPRALGPALGTRVELRKPSHLILVGDVRVPQVAGRVEGAGAQARVTFDVAPSTPHTLVQEGTRLVLRFEADALDAALPGSGLPDLVQAVRPGETPAAVVIDLGPRAASFKSAETPGDRGSLRLSIDIAPQAADQAPATPPPPLPPAPPLIDLAPSGGLRTIVLDAGHGGEDEGVRGPGGTLEKNVSLSVATKLRAALESRLGVRVILTRDADRSVGVDERAAVANNNKADLFISLHANASFRAATAGAEVYYLSLEEYGEEGQRVAHGDADLLPVFGATPRSIEVTPWDLAQARYIDQSAALAGTMAAALKEQVPVRSRAVSQAPFRVLVGTNMPAVLVEMAFLTNPEQERAATTDTYQNAVVQALVSGIVRYRDQGSGPGGQ
jgi:N-acetylmuramoyl-L-alanine amidase